jgi:SSS family solute:Na+ symporter
MVGILLLCALLAPGIRDFKGVFAYLVQLWSLLAPPVFVCVVAGIFTTTATSLGATATLAVGSTLGAVTFWALGAPEASSALPRYLQSPLNCGLVITLVCTAVLLTVSRLRPAGPPTSIETWRPGASSASTLTDAERRIYRRALGALAVLWLTVLYAFSPLGWAASRAG